MSRAYLNKENAGGVPVTFPEHDCLAWNSEHWSNQAELTYTSCGICNRITRLRYKSFWRRFIYCFVREF